MRLSLSGLATAFALSATPASAAPLEHDEHCSKENYTQCLNGASSPVTNGAALRANAKRFGHPVKVRGSNGTAVESNAGDGATGGGMSSGDRSGPSVFALWASYSYADFSSDFAVAGNSLAYDARAHSGLVGFDRLFGERLLLGMSGGYSRSSADTHYNGGGQHSNAYTVAPYAALLFYNYFSVDVSAGYATVDYAQHRISPVDGTPASADFDGDRWFGSTNLNAFVTRGQWTLGSKAGYTYSYEKQDGYREIGSVASAVAGRLKTVGERRIDLGQFSAGADVAYAWGSFEPYVAASYLRDLGRHDGNSAGGLPVGFKAMQPSDKDEVQFNVGVRYHTWWGVTSSLEYTRTEGRSDFDSDVVALTVRAAL